jgi:sterol desaturase/sphingolipid hydroxylase (fatty acid hydroxylase superfamily)
MRWTPNFFSNHSGAVMSEWLTRLVRLSRREYFADFFITPPITIALLIWSIATGWSSWWPVQFVAGICVWTLYEYAMHRWILHRTWLFRALHDLHHDDQRDYIALHPVLTIASYIGFALLFGMNSSAFMVGFSVGYVIYSAAHTAFHYAIILPGSGLFSLKRHHALHHRFHGVNYGVTTRVWDVAFGTMKS